MEKIVLKSIIHWHQLMKGYRSSLYKFRGQSNSSWLLLPKAGRDNYIKINDEIIFKQWKRRAKFYLQYKNFDDWELLSIAQHTGLPTRLLDWSHNPLVALFFSCCENYETDGAVFIYPADKFILTEKNSPFNIKSEILFYQPITSNERLANQYGYFSIHKDLSKEFQENSKYGKLIKLIIPNKLKPEIINMLNQYGINYLTLFPDLEGLSKHLSWFYNKTEHWTNSLEYE
ncbi:FRG domain-containing protein [Chryseobacterium daecheongense]|uniref:FRG domain-containing protein n=1 Tax=Chryseobacterium daecheongense TaxID=192389 RepID=UPI001FD69B0F|nr:FRG domain-containing protein [Chryseobacterium daecheongense]UOU97746.1 FRG domain-containing protein [Chryseobacterium daecheongense]